MSFRLGDLVVLKIGPPDEPLVLGIIRDFIQDVNAHGQVVGDIAKVAWINRDLKIRIGLMHVDQLAPAPEDMTNA